MCIRDSRLGIFAKDSKTGEYKNYTGNMSALLIAEYRISQMQEKEYIWKAKYSGKGTDVKLNNNAKEYSITKWKVLNLSLIHI